LSAFNPDTRRLVLPTVQALRFNTQNVPLNAQFSQNVSQKESNYLRNQGKVVCVVGVWHKTSPYIW